MSFNQMRVLSRPSQPDLPPACPNWPRGRPLQHQGCSPCPPGASRTMSLRPSLECTPATLAPNASHQELPHMSLRVLRSRQADALSLECLLCRSVGLTLFLSLNSSDCLYDFQLAPPIGGSIKSSPCCRQARPRRSTASNPPRPSRSQDLSSWSRVTGCSCTARVRLTVLL